MIRFAGDSFKFEKRRQHFIRTHNETFSVAAIRALCAPVSARSLLPKSFNPESSTLSTQKMHTHEMCSREGRRGVDLISDAPPFGQCYGAPNWRRLKPIVDVTTIDSNLLMRPPRI